LHTASDEVAAGLVERGVGEGDVIALVLPSTPEHLVAYAAAAKVGAITAAVNSRLTAPERATVLARAGPRLVLTTAELAPADTETLIVERVNCAADMLDGLRVRGTRPGPLAPDSERPVAVVFTSGTTGLPKGAVFCGRQLDFITGVDTGHRWGGGGATLAGTSLAHLGPMTKLSGNLHRGGTMVLTERWQAGEALRLTAEHGMASVAGIPTQLALMLRHPDFDRFDLGSVRAVVMGGGPATPALIAEARRRFGAPVAVRYSCTEAGIGLGTALDDPPEDAEVSVGRPHPGVELTIRRPDGRVLGPGEEGEVCLRSPAVMAGYHRDPEATARAFTADGAVRTGDLGYVDDRGRLRLVGRATERFVRGGYNVHPVEVEAVLAAHPAVADVAVVPRLDDVMGEIGVAVIVARAGAAAPTLDDLRSFAAARLARHKLPEALVVADSLPLTPMEKVDRRRLADLIKPPFEDRAF
jgi:acyl-CoA synthetase (AMP-forming)/AMP-acid ligase II